MSTIIRAFALIALLLLFAVFMGGTIGEAISAKVNTAIDNAIHYRNP